LDPCRKAHEVTPSPQLRIAIRSLFTAWLRDCRQQVQEYLATSEDGTDPAHVAAACPATFGDLGVVTWMLDGTGPHEPGGKL